MRRFISPWTILCLGVVAFIVFTGDNSVFQSIEHERTMLYYRDLNRRLASDPALMEQVVREQYGMKRASEDVYVFTEE